MMQTNETDTQTTTTTTTTTETVTPQPTPPAQTLGAFLPQWATTPKRGRARKTKREPAALLAYAMEHGPTIDLTNAQTIAALEAAGLRRIRIPNAVCDLKKYYGVTVKAERTGRTVTSYHVQLP